MIAALTLSGCGGSSKPPTVAVTASVTTVDGADTVKLTATVTNDKGTDGVAWSVSGGGALSDTTTSSATYTAPAATSAAQTVTVTATSVADTTQTGSVTVSVAAKPAITAPSSTQLTGAVGSAYSLQLAGSGGISPYTWTLTGGTLPTGWTLTTAGLLSGPAPVAGQAGSIDLTFTVTDSGSPTALTATEQLLVTITAAQGIIFTGTMPATATYESSSPYVGFATATGGAGSLTYSVSSGSLPPGLILMSPSNGEIGGTPTAAGAYNFTIKASDAYGDSATQAYTITVNPAAPTLAFTAIPTHTFGDAAFTASASSASSGAITYSLTSGPATINGSTGVVTLTGAGTVVLGSSQVASGNYAAATASITFTVNKGTATVAVTPYTVTYDGNAHTATATATGVGGVSLSASDVTLTGTTHTNAGTYASDAWSFSDPSGNYINTSGTVSDKISKATATVSVTGYSVTYDGTAHTATATATGLGGVNLIADLNLTGTTHTAAGTYATDAWSFADANYASASGTVSDTISKATATTSVTGYTVTYDGTVHTATATATGLGGVTLSASDFTLTGTAHTNAGTYASDAWSFTDPNYASASGTVSDKINQATATIVVTPYTVTYDGNAHTATATATGAGGANLIADLTLSGTTHTNAGTYVGDAWSFTDPNGNYVSASGTGSDTINQATPALSFAAIPTHTFGDAAFTASAKSASTGAITYSVTTGPASIDSATGLVTLSGASSVTLGASQAATANYTSATASITFAVNKAAATVVVTGYTVTYDNAPHTATATATGVGGVSLAAADVTLAGTTHTNAGTYASDAWSFADPSGNYAAASGTVSDKINQAPATINVTGYTVPYDGNAHTATATATGVGGISLSATDFTLTGTTHTTAGTYATDAWSFADANYASATGTVSDTISKATATINVTGYTVTYDGTVHTATATATGLGGVTLSSSDFTLTGTAHTNAGTYASDAWSFTDPNYASATGTVSDKINQATANIVVTPYTVTYDGNAHTATATATGVGGANLIADLTLSGTTHTNAGTYVGDAWSFTDPNGNYVSANGTVSDTINQATPALAFAAIPNHTFGDAAFAASATSASSGAITYSLTTGPASIDSATGLVTLSGAGSVTLGASQAATANYTAATATITFTVNKAAATIVVTPYTVTFDGTAHTATATATGVGGVNLSGTDFTLTSTTHTNAGTYATDAWRFSDPSGNYNNASGTTPDKINQATAAIVVTQYSVTYDATAHTATGTATGVGGVNLIAGLTLSGTTHTNAGSYTTDPWSFSDASGNYANASGTVSDTISKATATINVTGYSATYDGNAHTATATATGVGGVSLSAADFTLTGTTHTTAGTYATDAWSFADLNYLSASGTVSDTIAKAPATINVTGYTVTYDSNAHTATATATGVGGISLNLTDFTLTGTAHTSAGTYAGDAWSFADPNYLSTSGTVNDQINQAAATIHVTPYTVTYDGNPHTATATATGAGGVNLIADVTLTGTTHTAAGTYATDAWSFLDPTGNYSSIGGVVTDTINQATATIHVTPYTVTYDGNPHTATGTATGVGGLALNSNDLNLSATTHINAGSYTLDSWSFTDPSGNYASANGVITDTINGANPGLAFTPIGTKVYGTPTTGDGPFQVTATSTSVGAITYSRTNGFTSAGTVTPLGVVTLTGAGTVYLTASQAASGNYAAATATTSFQVNPTLTITTPLTLPTGAVGTPYSQQLQGTGGFGTFSWSTDGAGSTNLSAVGLGLSSSGLVSGTTPIANGPETFTVTLSDGSGHTAQATFSVTVSSITITTTTLPIAYTGASYSQPLTSVGGAGGNVWSVTGANNLATYGLTLSTSGLLSGTLPSNAPTGIGVVTFTAQVKDKNNLTVTKPLTITVYGPLTLQTVGSLHPAITGSDYGVNNVGINASGGSGSYSFAVNGTSIPNNSFPTTIASADSLTGANSGGNTLFLGGTPPDSGTITLNVTVTDTGVTPTRSYGPIQYTILAAPQQPLALPAPSTNPLPTPVNINQGYNAGINATGGANGVNYSFTVQIGGVVTTIPTDNSPVTLINGNGLTAQNSGGFTLMISGTPNKAGNLTLLVTVNDTANDPPASQSYAINIVNPAAGYNVSGTVNYLGSKTGWIYLQLSNNSCPNCGGNPGTAIPAKGTFTIKGVQAGTYTLQAYMDPSSLGFGAPNASDPAGSTSNIAGSSGAVSGANVTLADPGAITFGSAPSISVAGAFATGALVQFSNLPRDSNSMELATSYTVQYSTSPTFSTGAGILSGSQSFPASGGSKAPSIVSGLTNGKTYYFEVQAVAGSSTSSWSAPTAGVAIAATPATGNNAVSGKITFPGTATGPLYVGFYDQNTNIVYATVVGTHAAPPTSPASYSVNVPTGSNYYFFAVLDQNNNGLLDGPGQISNTDQQSSAVTVINAPTTTENLTLPTSGTAPKNSEAVIRTQHNQQINSSGTNDNYNIDIRVDGLYKLPVSVEVISKPAVGAVVVPSDWATGAFNGNNNEFDFQPNLNGVTPQVGDAYNLLVTYSDGTSETLTVTIGAVLNAFATLVLPASQATNVSPTPNFSWTDPTPSGNYTYQFQLQDSNYNTIWQIPGNNSNSNGMSNSITAITWNVDPTGIGSLPSTSALNSLSMYQWSIQAADASGNSATEQVSFETGESAVTLPSNSNPGSALVNSPYSQSLNASGGSGSGYVFNVNGSAGTTNAGVTTWTLTDGLTASSTVGNSTLTVSGTPTTAPATVTLAVSVVDSQSHSAGPVTYTINVVSGPNGAHNAYMLGTYVCKSEGFNDSDGSRWSSLSSFVADGTNTGGKGNLSSGIFDVNSSDQTSAASGTAAGTYSVGSDNNGVMTLNDVLTGGGSFSSQWAIALNNYNPLTTATELRMVMIDTNSQHGTADCYLATTGAFAAATISGKSFAFGVQGESWNSSSGTGTPKANVGRFSASGGNITSGILDGMRVDQSGDNGGTFTGSYTAPSATTGRFTLTLTPTVGGGSITFAAYVIDAKRMFVLETAGDSGEQAGDMRTQQQTSYSGANLNGAFVFYTQGFEYSNKIVSGYDAGVSQATGNGAGNITINQSYQDSNGTYQVGKENGATIGVTFDPSNPGRVTFTPGSDSIYWYFFDTNSAFHLDLNGTGYLETGWIEPQSQTTFTDAAVAGTYLFGQMPAMQESQLGDVGEFDLLSNGNITAGMSEAGQGDFTYDQSQSMSYAWDTTATGTGSFLIGSGSKGASCAVISATKAACIGNGDSSPAVMIFQK